MPKNNQNDFNLAVLDERPIDNAGNAENVLNDQYNAPVLMSKKRDLHSAEYTLNYLAKQDEGQDLEGNLKKARNDNARGGKEYQIIFMNETDLVIRREYVLKAKLLVIIPEKAIYNIYDELTGALMSSNDLYEINKFAIKLPEAIQVEIDKKLVWILGQERNKWNSHRAEYMEYYQVKDYTNLLKFVSSSHWRKIMAYLTKQKPAIVDNETFAKYMAAANFFSNEVEFEKLRIAVRLMTQGITWLDARHLLDVTGIENVNQFDSNILKNCIEISKQMKDKLKEDDLYYVVRNYDSHDNIISPTHILRMKNAGIDVWVWYEWAKYLWQVEEYNIFRQINHYFDVIKQQVALNNGKIREKYPKMWLSYENKIQAIYRRNEKFLKDKRSFSYSPELEVLEHKTDKNNKDWEHVLLLPRTYGDIIEEGANMKSCVASYGDKVYNHETTILLLRRKKKQDVSWVTVEVKRGKLNDKLQQLFELKQVKGISNTNPDDEAIWYLAKWMDLPQNKGRFEVTDWYLKQRIEAGAVEEYQKVIDKRREQAKLAAEKAAAEKAQGIKKDIAPENELKPAEVMLEAEGLGQDNV